MTDMTLRDLFFSGGDEGDALEGASLVELESEIKEQLPRVSMGAVQEEMSAKIGEVLDVGLGDVIAAAWQKVEALWEYADPEQHPPNETILLPLARHAISSEHAPHVDLKIKRMLVASIRLQARVGLKLEGVVLKVQGGKIHGIQAGACQASGSLVCRLESKVGTKELLKMEKETSEFRLQGTLGFGDGIPIWRPGGDD